MEKAIKENGVVDSRSYYVKMVKWERGGEIEEIGRAHV